jgi:chaperonin GroEL (HSP60 family)
VSENDDKHLVILVKDVLRRKESLKGMEAYCFAAFAGALEVIPTTLAENAGLNPIAMVAELRKRHAFGERTAGINVRKGVISNILEENVVAGQSTVCRKVALPSRECA